MDPNETIFTRINKCDFSDFDKPIRTTMKNFKDKIEDSFRLYCTEFEQELVGNTEYNFLWFIKHLVYKRFLYLDDSIQDKFITDFKNFMNSEERIFKDDCDIKNKDTVIWFHKICQNLYKLGTRRKDWTDKNNRLIYRDYNNWQKEVFDILIYLYLDDVKNIVSEELYNYLTIIIRHDGKYNKMDKGGFFYES